MKLTPRKPINSNDSLGRGMDLALVTLVFVGLGWLVDNWLGTKPVFIIGFVVFALVGQFVKMWYDYDGAMQRHEAERVPRHGSRPMDGAAADAASTGDRSIA